MPTKLMINALVVLDKFQGGRGGEAKYFSHETQSLKIVVMKKKKWFFKFNNVFRVILLKFFFGLIIKYLK
jgi:hypothetical protein